ncbi:SMC domain-containing protein [Desulfatibacillum aliphaticivorans]|uniref:SMC domain-containing protein n=1 Tax=Desulfatibacillum aliphaticivorans TaxID=218208 RepID=B8FIC6_DESAL|nr:ATP-binding protein [Desulfatibacillum aliphaticivorans]ACL03916.1 SMC domain-containing protein [Desulfatibacillum aliphaticivorans]
MIISRMKFSSFKSMEKVDFQPGVVNIFVGANGSGKSNLLEAIGVLSAAASGRVDDESLKRRGVRPGLPSLYKCAFPGIKESSPIEFSAWNEHASYEVSLLNPIKEPLPEWRYDKENLWEDDKIVIDRRQGDRKKYNPEAGLAALSMVELDAQSPSAKLLKALRDFAIYSPDTNTLRGISPDLQQRPPIGLAGGQLPIALDDLLIPGKPENDSFIEKVRGEALALIDWAESYSTDAFKKIPVSPGFSLMQKVIQFEDRFMKRGRNILSGYDASEGALFVLFHAALAAHPKSPTVCAVDNADHALNPRLAKALLTKVCGWYLDSPRPRQIFLTTHNPQALDGIPLQNDKVRLFTVSRTESGRTVVNRIELNEKLQTMADKGWTLSRLWVMGHLGGVANV